MHLNGIRGIVIIPDDNKGDKKQYVYFYADKTIFVSQIKNIIYNIHITEHNYEKNIFAISVDHIIGNFFIWSNDKRRIKRVG